MEKEKNMKKNIINLFLILVLAFINVALFGNDAKIDITANMDNLQNVPQAVYRYAADQGKSEMVAKTRELWTNLNKYANTKLDVTLLVDGKNPEEISINTADAFFNVFSPNTNGYLFTKPLDKYIKAPAREKKLLDKGQAEVAAKDYLTKLNILPPASDGLYPSYVGKVRTAVYNTENKQTTTEDKMYVVFYSRKLDNFPVVGASRCVVRVANDGELVGVIKNWPRLEKVTIAQNKIHPKSNWQNLASDKVKQLNKAENSIALSLKTAEVIMYDDGVSIIEPALLVKGAKTSAAGKTTNSSWIVPLMKNPEGRFAANTAPDKQ
jgi:hypothetical protein